MEKGDYTVSNIYQGGTSSFKPTYGDVFTGYHVASSELGAPTKPDTANQIQQVSQMLNQGIVPIEAGVLDPKVFDQIPKTHFKEIRRMAKLSGAKISVHAPLVEPSGISEQGWNETSRKLAEKQLKDVVEKSYEMDSQGNIPITIHSSGLPGTEYKMTPEGKKIEKLMVINQETGKPAPLEEEKKLYPGREGETIMTINQQLESINHTEWLNGLTSLAGQKQQVDDIMKDAVPSLIPILTEYKEGQEISLTPQQQVAMQQLERADIFMQNVESGFNGMFDKASKYGDEKENLKIISNEWKKGMEEIQKDPNIIKMITLKSEMLSNALNNMKRVDAPKIYVPIEKFAKEKSSETFANVALDSYKKFGEKSPIISIENMFPGMAFASGEGMDKLITESREKFVNKAIEKGMDKSTAQEKAEKLIGMTLDVGHLNIARKKGFSEKDLVKEVGEIAKHVKHVHLTDNFGYDDSHLPPGMGNVPFKDLLQELEKKGDMKGVRKIVEAGGWFQHFGTSPYPQALEAMGSPIYSMQMGPYWNQAGGLQQGYMSGYGNMLPSTNYQMFGAGFSQLPAELGGQKGEAGGGMSQTPME